MSRKMDGDESARDEANDFASRHPESSRFVFGAFWGLLWVGSFLVSAPWAGFHGVLFACVGLLLWLRPPPVSLPRPWWILAVVFALAGAAALLPVSGFAVPDWRRQLVALGVETGPLVAIQARQAAEMLAIFAITLVGGLWLAGHRASPSQVRRWALAFTLGVACYALAARLMQNSLQSSLAAGEGHFGFFPNRNHTATYLAMGTLCGLGCVVQALRDKRFVVMSIALAATGVCLWAVAAWSISRAGVVLVAAACLLWLPLLGRRYLGRHGLWAVGLIALAAIGLFFIADSSVKQRLTQTIEKAGTLIGAEGGPAAGEGTSALESGQNLDFRIPVALDTLDLIRDFKWTGIGAGQFYYVFPQYRKRTTVAQDADGYHPESDWLWMAAETGIPATLALLALVLLAFWKSLAGVLRGRDRALRSACLVAALLVPLHGIFDVPGHRITLAWSAAFLFALSLHSPTASSSLARTRFKLFRFLAFPLLAAAVFLIRAQWGGGSQPALTTAKVALAEAQRLYADDQRLQKAATAKGAAYQPDPAADKLEQALQILNHATPVAPLDRDLLRYQAFLAFHFDDKQELIDRTFAIDRALLPGRVALCLRQAEALLAVDPRMAAAIAREALVRSVALTRIDPQNRWRQEQVRGMIAAMAAKSAEPECFSFTDD
jgi:hypothetical protein